ncbi:MAG: tRNA pseudouridine(38-40) synthase TruA [Actinomycetales bacterium]|nr:MAG: tRNA pseudouridine(38-40) synthase TruA [Actinomycetales bacterium]
MELTLSQTVRLRLDLSYHGAKFHGWASQTGLRTVQGEVESALAVIFRQPISLTVAGRTDAGVHATGQVAHFDISKALWQEFISQSSCNSASVKPEISLLRRLNSLLAESKGKMRGYSDVVIYALQIVPDTFDARFSALWREYTYLIADRQECWSPLRSDVLWYKRELNVEQMHLAAQKLLGEHDFLSYCKPRAGASTVRTLLALNVERQADGLVCATIRADAFCHSQVRTLMGALIEVGRGVQDIDWPAQRLAEANREGIVIVAPAHPLTLAKVAYPEPEKYGVQAELARTYRGVESSESNS